MEKEEVIEEVDEGINMVMDSNIGVFSLLIKPSYIVWTPLQNPMQTPISTAQPLPSLMKYLQCIMELQEVIQQKMQQKEKYCLHLLEVL
jgi:hypothetical protein